MYLNCKIILNNEFYNFILLAEANTSQKGKGNKENVGVDISQLQGTVGAVLDVLSADKSPLTLLG